MISKNYISELLREVEQLFSEAGLPTARLDAELLLAHVLEVDRPWLHAHGDTVLQSKALRAFEQLAQRRLQREPVAYIIGHKEFYGREFVVTPDVLIPRPETEDLVELALEVTRAENRDSETARESTTVIDIGCGSGCIGITLKLEQPRLDVTLADISPAALKIAQSNARKLGAEVTCVTSNLLSDLRSSVYHLILANLPYVDEAWERSPETDHEPALALFANNQGLELVYRLIEQTSTALKPGGFLLLETDPEQHRAVKAYAPTQQLEFVKNRGYGLSFVKQL